MHPVMQRKDHGGLMWISLGVVLIPRNQIEVSCEWVLASPILEHLEWLELRAHPRRH